VNFTAEQRAELERTVRQVQKDAYEKGKAEATAKYSPYTRNYGANPRVLVAELCQRYTDRSGREIFIPDSAIVSKVVQAPGHYLMLCHSWSIATELFQ
jgi:hypothetical protein